MPSTIKVKKHDQFRALISDVLPYETPMIFSNHGLHKANHNGLVNDNNLKLFFEKGKVGASKPYTISVTKPNGDIRELHIPHPALQISIANFIYDNSEIILSRCSISSFSIRRPFGVTSYFKEFTGKSWKHFLQKDMEVEEDDPHNDESDEDGFANSFFTYRSHTLLYKYFKSLEFLSLEKRFKYHGKFDISKCFPSIYTHSLAWAIKGKEFSKKNKKANTFENRFDNLMMLTNDGESHGIIVGPEFSRIFAEIILQRIDLNVEKSLDLKGYKIGRDYKVHRYVDDYFIYSNDEELILKIKTIFKEELMKYKLFTNESKDSLVNRPFISNLGIAKAEVENELDLFFKKLKSETDNESFTLDYIRNPYQASQSLINKIRLNIKLNNVSVEAFSGLLFSVFRSKISIYLNELKSLEKTDGKNSREKNEARYVNFIIFCLDVLFFVYSQNIRVRTSFLLSQILVLVKDFYVSCSEIGKKKIIKKLKDESRILFSILESNTRPKIETLNLILSLSSLFEEVIEFNSHLKRYFGEIGNFDYFEAICCIYLLCKEGKNKTIMGSILDNYEKALLTSPCPSKDCSLSFFLLDFVTYPDDSLIKKKKYLVKLFLERSSKEKISSFTVNKTLNAIIQNEYWFVDWGRLNLKRILVRKESQSTYS